MRPEGPALGRPGRNLDYSQIFCRHKASRAAAQRIVAEAVRPRSGVPENDEPRSGDRVLLMCKYAINCRHDISRIEFCRRYAAQPVWGRLTEASRPRLQFSAPLRGL